MKKNTKKKKTPKKQPIGKYETKELYTSTILKFNIIITNKNNIDIAPTYIIIISTDKNSAPNNNNTNAVNTYTLIKYKTDVIEFLDMIIKRLLIIISGLNSKK
jgi:hypothetical protein